MIFAVANVEGKSPVKVSAQKDLPKAGSVEAEQIMGRAAATGPVIRDEGKKRFPESEPQHVEV